MSSPTESDTRRDIQQNCGNKEMPMNVWLCHVSVILSTSLLVWWCKLHFVKLFVAFILFPLVLLLSNLLLKYTMHLWMCVWWVVTMTMCVCVAYERWSKDVVRAFFLMESRFVLELTETETDSSPQNRRMQYNSFLLSSAVVSAVAVVQWNEEDAWGKCTNAGGSNWIDENCPYVMPQNWTTNWQLRRHLCSISTFIAWIIWLFVILSTVQVVCILYLCTLLMVHQLQQIIKLKKFHE